MKISGSAEVSTELIKFKEILNSGAEIWDVPDSCLKYYPVLMLEELKKITRLLEQR